MVFLSYKVNKCALQNGCRKPFFYPNSLEFNLNTKVEILDWYYHQVPSYKMYVNIYRYKNKHSVPRR